MILYYIKKIRPWHSQTNLSISVLIFGKSYYSQTVTYFLDVDISFRHLQNHTTSSNTNLFSSPLGHPLWVLNSIHLELSFLLSFIESTIPRLDFSTPY